MDSDFTDVYVYVYKQVCVSESHTGVCLQALFVLACVRCHLSQTANNCEDRHAVFKRFSQMRLTIHIVWRMKVTFLCLVPQRLQQCMCKTNTTITSKVTKEMFSHYTL